MIFVLAKISSFFDCNFYREVVRTRGNNIIDYPLVRTCDGRCPHFVGSSESNGGKGLKKGLQKDKEVPVCTKLLILERTMISFTTHGGGVQ